MTTYTDEDEMDIEVELDIMNPNHHLRYEFIAGGAYSESFRHIVTGLYKELDSMWKCLQKHEDTDNKLRLNIAHERNVVEEKFKTLQVVLSQHISGITANLSEAMSANRTEIEDSVTAKQLRFESQLKAKLDVIDNLLAQILERINSNKPGKPQRIALDATTFNGTHIQKALYTLAKDAWDCEDVSDEDYRVWWEQDGTEYSASPETIINFAKAVHELVGVAVNDK